MHTNVDHNFEGGGVLKSIMAPDRDGFSRVLFRYILRRFRTCYVLPAVAIHPESANACAVERSVHVVMAISIHSCTVPSARIGRKIVGV